MSCLKPPPCLLQQMAELITEVSDLFGWAVEKRLDRLMLSVRRSVCACISARVSFYTHIFTIHLQISLPHSLLAQTIDYTIVAQYRVCGGQFASQLSVRKKHHQSPVYTVSIASCADGFRSVKNRDTPAVRKRTVQPLYSHTNMHTRLTMTLPKPAPKKCFGHNGSRLM